MSGKTACKIFEGLEDEKEEEGFSLDSLVSNMKKYDMNELYFLRDCIDFMIIYNRSK